MGQGLSGLALMQKQKNSHQVSLRSDSISLSLNLRVIVNHINGTDQRWPRKCDSGTIIIVYTLHLWNARNHSMEKKFLQITLDSCKIKFKWCPDLQCVHWEHLFCFFSVPLQLGISPMPFVLPVSTISCPKISPKPENSLTSWSHLHMPIIHLLLHYHTFWNACYEKIVLLV